MGKIIKLPAVSHTCILTFISSKLTLHVKNEAPIVGAISFEYKFETYFTTRLVFPTPEKEIYKLTFLRNVFFSARDKFYG